MFSLLKRSSERRVAIIGLLILGGTLAVYFGAREHPVKERAAARESITICYSWTLGQLIGVAQAQGFFADEGLAVTLKAYAAGRDALNALLAEECVLANVADTPIVFKAWERQDFRVVATTRTVEDHNQIIARADRGVAAPRDLRGKRIGVLRGTAAHFFLYRFLLEQGLTARDVTLVFADGIPMLRAALLQGELDAVALWQPYIAQWEAALGKRALVFTAPGLVLTTTNIVAQERLVRDRPQLIPPLLRALKQALAFAADEPQVAMAAVARVTGASHQEVAATWSSHEISLSQALLLSLEDEARWAVQSGLVKPSIVPNFLRLLYLDGLASVDPPAVTVLH